jgi:hypothetical protein
MFWNTNKLRWIQDSNLCREFCRHPPNHSANPPFVVSKGFEPLLFDPYSKVLSITPRNYLHPLTDSNCNQRFWRPACYHYTKEIVNTNIDLVVDSNHIVFSSGTRLIRIVGSVGVEPTTFSVSARCSNQMS